MKPLNYGEIADKIKARRLALGYSFQELALRANMSKTTLYRYESGDIKNIPIARVRALSEALQMKPEELIGIKVDTVETASPAPASPKAQRIGRAYDKADPPIKAIVETALKPYMPDDSRTDTEFAAEIAPVIDFPKTILPHFLQRSTAGFGNYLDDDYYEMREFENAPKRANIAVTVSGDSMEPRYCPGDVIFVETDSVLEDGEIGIFCHDGQSYIKQLRLDPPRLVSLNKAYKDIPLEDEKECRTIGRVLDKVK